VSPAGRRARPWRAFAALGALASLGACGGGGGGDAPLSAALSSVSVVPGAGLPADGTTAAAIDVVVRNADGSPLAGQIVQISASGSGNALVQPAGPTDARSFRPVSMSSMWIPCMQRWMNRVISRSMTKLS